MNIIILNYNTTSRLKSRGPACLLKISPKKTILEHQIQVLNKIFEKPKIIVISGYKQKKINEILNLYVNIKTIENKYFEVTNCLYNIGLGIENISDNVLIIPGNIVLKENLFIPFDKNISQIWITKEKQEAGCTINNGLVSHFMWGLSNYISNIGYFTGQEFNLLKEIIQKDYNKNMFLIEGLNYILERGGIIYPIIKRTKLQIINKISDL